MTQEQIKQRVNEALEVLNPDNTEATAEQKVKAWLFIKETLQIIYK